jgi:predicted amidohydrolase
MIRVLSVCANTRLGMIRENVARLEELIRGFAARQPVDIVVMSEIATTGFIDRSMGKYAETPDSDTFTSFKKLSSAIGALVGWGFVERNAVSGAKPYNSFALVQGSQVLGICRKTHLNVVKPGGPESADEVGTFTPGHELCLLDTPLGKIGIAICMDGCFPEVFRTLCLRGADLLVWPSRSWGFQADLHIPLNRAYENVTPLVHCDGWQFCDIYPESRGHAQICDHAGKVLANCESPDELMYAELDLDAARWERENGEQAHRWKYLRRPELYWKD